MRSYFAHFLFKIKSTESQELKKQRFDFEIPDNGDVIIAGEGLENVGRHARYLRPPNDANVTKIGSML